MDPNFSFFFLSDIKRLFFKKKYRLLLSFFIFFFIAFIFLLDIDPKYTAEATFFEDVDQSSTKTIGSLKDIVLSDSSSSASDATSFFRSKSLIKRLVKKLSLQVSIISNECFVDRKLKRAIKNLKLEFNKKIDDFQGLEFEDIVFEKTKSKSYYLKILNSNSFEVLDLNKKVLVKSNVDERVFLKDLSFKVKNIPDIFFNKTLKIKVEPLDVVVNDILKNIQITNDKTKPSFLLLKTKNENRYLSAKILNTLMDLYIEHLKKETKRVVQNQLEFLETRKKLLEKDLFSVYATLENDLKSNVKTGGFVDLNTEISTLLRKREIYQTNVNESVKELSYLKSLDLDKIDEISSLDPNLINLIDEIKRLTNKKKALAISIEKDNLDDENINEKTVDIENTIISKNSIDRLINDADKNRFLKDQNLNLSKPSRDQDLYNNTLNFLDLADAKEQITDLSKKREDTILEISQINHILKNVDKDTFQSSIAALPEHLTGNINEIEKKIEDAKNYTIKEVESLKEEYYLEKKIIKSYLIDSLNLKNMNLKILKQQLNIAKKIEFKLLNQEISFLYTKAKDYIFEKILKLSDEKIFLENELESQKNQMQALVEKLSKEKKINLQSERTKNTIDSLSKLIESKNIDFNLKKINSKPIDLASIPSKNITINLFRNAFLLSFLGVFFTFIFCLYMRVIKGFAVSKDAIESLNYDFFGKISFKCNGVNVDQLKINDLESLRKIISSIDEKKHKIITAICSNGPNYIHYLAALLAISGKKILVIETKSAIEAENGLFPYLERNIDTLPVQKMQAYDYIASGNQKYFSFELLKSLDFIQMIDSIKIKYDLILIYSTAKINSAEARIYLDFSDKIILSIKEETLDDLKLFLSWANEKTKLCFGTY